MITRQSGDKKRGRPHKNHLLHSFTFYMYYTTPGFQPAFNEESKHTMQAGAVWGSGVMAATGDLKSPGRETVWVRVPPSLPHGLIRVEAYPRGGKRKSAMSSLVKSQETHVSHRGAAESRIRSICLGSSEEEHRADNAGVGISIFPSGTTGEGAQSVITSTSHGRSLWRTSGPIIHKSPLTKI